VALIPWKGAAFPPRRWQREALPVVLRALGEGRKPIVRACTGAGKSVFTAELCWLAHSRGRLSVLVVPTQALVEQSAATLRLRGEWGVARWYGTHKEIGDTIVCCYPSLSTLLIRLAEEDRTIDLLIADECHGSEAETRRADIEATEARWMVGVTATPYRADEAEALSLWTDICYEYGTADAIRDGVLVPIRVIEPDVPEHPPTLVDDALEMTYHTLPTRPDTGRIRPGVVSSQGVDDAEAYTQRLQADGWRAAAVHYQVSKADVAARVEALRTGELDMLVHVSMLSEGVDFPWLWWVALRRPLSSRVALVQTVGRVVRIDRDDPTKTVGTIIDPHGICSSVGLVHSASLGAAGALQEADPRSSEPTGPTVPILLDGRLVKVRASDAERRWRELAAGLEMAGLIEPGISRGRWSRRPATPKQRAALGRMSWATRHLPEPYRKPWRALTKHDDLTAGCAADLLTLAVAAADGGKDARLHRRAWTLTLEMETA